jgi:hypothetical protein
LIEFTLVGIPLIFILISTVELSRGMWLYHTLAYAMREGVRFAIVHGNNCNLPPNNCVVTIREISGKVRDGAVGFLATDLQNTVFRSPGKVVICPTLNDCLQPGALGDTYWPANAPGAGDATGADRVSRIEISAIFPFRSAIAMFWPGAGPGQNFGTLWLPASSKERIQY